MKNRTTPSVLLSLLLGAASAHAASISLNFSIGGTDTNTVDPGESAATGIPSAEPIDGAFWNNVTTRNSGFGAPGLFTTTTQGGSFLNLVDSSGANAAQLTSVGNMYSNITNVTADTGNGGLLGSMLLLNSSESITISGLAAWAPQGYSLVAFFDIGNATRTYGLQVSDGGPATTYWTSETPTDSDGDNTGAVTWTLTDATTSGAAITDANYAVYSDLSGDSLTISGQALSGRATLSGLQIVANAGAVPEPSSTLLLGLAGAGLLARRRRS